MTATGKMQFGCRVVFPGTMRVESVQSKRNGFVAHKCNNGGRQAFYEFSLGVNTIYNFITVFPPELRFAACRSPALDGLL